MKPEPEPVVVKIVDVVVMKKGAPGYMVSFGDMMTLILCFFILLVSMAKERNYGMLAKGIGSFVVQLKSHGLTGVLSGAEKKEVFNQVRRRFNLPPEADPERRSEHSKASSRELLRASSVELLVPHREVGTPRIAAFGPGEVKLTESSKDYLNQLAATLMPRRGQLLVLEGHATDAPPRTSRSHIGARTRPGRAGLPHFGTRLSKHAGRSPRLVRRNSQRRREHTFRRRSPRDP